MLLHLKQLRVREIKTGDICCRHQDYFQIAGVSSTREEKEGVNAEGVMCIPSQDQGNVQAFSQHFIHTRGRTVVQMESPVWEGGLARGRG